MASNTIGGALQPAVVLQLLKFSPKWAVTEGEISNLSPTLSFGRQAAEGKAEERLQIAKSLLDILDDHTIAAKTGLRLDEINKLRHP